MAITAALSLSTATPGINISTIGTITISNSGGSAVQLTAVTPYSSIPQNTTLSNFALPLTPITVPASGTAKVTFTAIFSAAGTYTLSAAVQTSDGSNAFTSPQTATVPSYVTPTQASYNFYDTVAANTVSAGPTTGNPAIPTFRSLVTADIPNTIKPMVIQLTQVQVTNKAAGGSIGAAAVTVDIGDLISVSQTTASQTLTLPSPTDTTPRMLYVTNNGSATFTMLSQSVTTAIGLQAVWDGQNWIFIA